MELTIVSPDGAGRRVPADEGQTLLDVLHAAGETVFAPCGGAGTCGRCRVLVRDGEGVGYRLACQTAAAPGLEMLLEGTADLHVEGAGRPADAAVRDDATFGVAVDIGTTTMVFFLVDLETRAVVGTLGKVNPQVAFGGDVIARINAADAPGGLETLCGLLRTSIDEAEAALCATAGIDAARIVRRAIVGNTTMEHFATGLDPHPIGISPFTPASLFGAETNLYAPAGAPDKRAYFAPAVAGYVGGDITAGLHASGMREADGLQLFIDIGTNGEMALGNRERMVCCATAAGPAFEGASITLGMPAMPGAVSAVRLTDGGLAIQTINGADPVGICGSGLLDAVACLVKAGLVDETGYLLDDEEAADAVAAPLARLVGEEQGQTVCYLDDARRVYLTQADIRKVQLAKAAIRAGIETMLAELHVSYEDVGRVVLAGGFGMHLDPHSATAIGLIPPALDDRIEALGNTAGAGAVACLFEEGRASVAAIAQACAYHELSNSKTFNEFYIDNMGFEE